MKPGQWARLGVVPMGVNEKDPVLLPEFAKAGVGGVGLMEDSLPEGTMVWVFLQRPLHRAYPEQDSCPSQGHHASRQRMKAAATSEWEGAEVASEWTPEMKCLPHH